MLIAGWGLATAAAAAPGDLFDEVGETRFPLKWETYIGLTTFRTTILYKDGKIVLGSNGEHFGGGPDASDGVFLLNAETGRILEHYRGDTFGDNDVNGVAWYRDILFFGDDNGSVHSFEESGKQRWRFDVSGDIEGAPALADLNGDYFPEVIFATEAGTVHAVDGRDGRELWSFKAVMEPAEGKYEWLSSLAFMASPAVIDLNEDGIRDVLIGSRNATFYALDGTNGQPLWKYHTHSGIHASALVTTAENDLRILFAEAYSGIHVLDRLGRRRGEGELEAPQGGIQGFFSSPVITASGSVLIGSAWWDDPDAVGSDDGYWIFHPFSSTREARKFVGTGRISATPFLADVLDEFYPQIGFVTENGWLLLVYHTGDIAGQFRMPAGAEATPLIADIDGDGRHELLIATRDKYLRCYDTPSEGRIEWGQFRGNNHNTGVMHDGIVETVPTIEILRQIARTYPRSTWITLGYLAVFLLVGLLYFVRPLTLLKIEWILLKIRDLPLPGPLAKFVQTPLSYLFFIRLFAYRPRVLDAWVAVRLSSARQQFENRQTVRARRVHIDLPAIVDGRAVSKLETTHLRSGFSRRRTVICLTGEGGSGKTSLACQMARRALEQDPAERLNPACPMIPVLLEPTHDSVEFNHSDDIIVHVRHQLGLLVDESLEDDHELVTQLLRRRRLLVMIDGLSEMSVEQRRLFLPDRPTFPAAATLVTSRDRDELRDLPKTSIETMRIEGTRLSSFMEAYLVETGEKAKFDDTEFFAVCGRLSRLVGDREITVLLAKMYADLVVAAKTRAVDLTTLPESVPDLMLGYIRILNDRIQDERINDQQVKEIAERIAWESLRTDYQPRPVNRNRLYTAYPESTDIDAGIEYLDTRMGLLSEEGPAAALLRFSLDPLAEYLAAIHLVEAHGDDEASWRAFLDKTREIDLTAPEVRGFFRALRDCCAAGLTDRTVPAFVAEELAARMSR